MPDTLAFKTARIVDIFQETAEIRSYFLSLEEEEDFQFTPGQFNMLGLPGVEEAAISFSSLAQPGNNFFMHTIACVGNVTSLIERMEIDGKLLIRGPFGYGWPTEEIVGKDILLVAGGVGLAPLRPFLLYCLEKRNQINNLYLVYGARTPEEMVFQKDLMDWQKKEEISTIYCVDKLPEYSSLLPNVGLVTHFLEDLQIDLSRALVCMCGPEIMMRFVARKLLLQGYSEKDLYLAMERRMRCGTGHCGHCQIGAKFVCQDGPIFQYPDIKPFADTML